MPPRSVGSVPAVLRQSLADGFIPAKIPFQVLRLGPRPEHEHPPRQLIRNRPPCLIQPPGPAIEVDEQDHTSHGPPSHPSDMVLRQTPEHFPPPARNRKHLHPVECCAAQPPMKSVCYLAVRIVFRQHEYVPEMLVYAHGSRSSRIKAPTRSPATCISRNGLTCVGSKWLLRCRRKVFSSENRRMTSGLCDVARNWPRS